MKSESHRCVYFPTSTDQIEFCLSSPKPAGSQRTSLIRAKQALYQLSNISSLLYCISNRQYWFRKRCNPLSAYQYSWWLVGHNVKVFLLLESIWTFLMSCYCLTNFKKIFHFKKLKGPVHNCWWPKEHNKTWRASPSFLLFRPGPKVPPSSTSAWP